MIIMDAQTMKQTGCFILLLVNVVMCSIQNSEPMCLSRFDYDYKVLSKLVTIEMELTEYKQQVRKLETKVEEQEKNLLASLDNFKLVSDMVNLAISEGTGTTYIRWGRTSCPANGTELLYKGFVGGSFYGHKGAAVNYLCLPEDPIWGHYESASQDSGAFVYGGEYEFNGRSRTDFFGKEVRNYDAVCAVCQTRRSKKIMIPGRNRCYDGWTLEYHGYLAAGYYGHEAASEYVCVDENLEVEPNSESDKNGILFYFSEVRCGSLKCPPYAENRELTCVVCTK